MSVVFVEGFDNTTNAQLAAYKGWSGGGIDVGSGRFGGQRIRHQGSSNNHALPGTYNSAIAGVAIFNNGFAVNVTLLSLRNGSTDVARLQPVTVGSNTVWRILNSSGTTLATGTTPIIASQWYYVELKAVANVSTGSVELRLNGASTAECSATSVNTGGSDINNLFIGATSGSAYFDDIYVVDTGTGSSPTNTFLGDVRIETLYPTSNGASTAWTGVYTDVDDPASVDDDTTYISSSTPGDRETYGLTDLTVTAGTVFAVQENLIARKDDAGVRTIAPVLRTGGVDYDGTTTAALTSTYAGYQQLYERLDPSGAGWTVSSVNSLEAGVKEVA